MKAARCHEPYSAKPFPLSSALPPEQHDGDDDYGDAGDDGDDDGGVLEEKLANDNEDNRNQFLWRDF